MLHVIEEMSSAVTGQDGEILGRLFILRDITKEKEIESFRQEMSHMLVHDLRSPLTAVITGLHIALEDVSNYPEHPAADTLRMSLEVSLNNSSALLAMIEEILDVNKLESGEMPLTFELVNLKTIASSAIQKLRGLADEAHIAVRLKAPDDLPDIMVDAEKMERVFINLIDNALKYAPDGGWVDVQIESGAAYQQVSVIDNGEGILPEHRERIFERFAQVSSARRQRGPKGTGLGLTFCRLAVEAHRGHIWVDDGPEKGTAFHFTLSAEGKP
jgi:signal transduction histidine kinase